MEEVKTTNRSALIIPLFPFDAIMYLINCGKNYIFKKSAKPFGSGILFYPFYPLALGHATHIAF